MLQSAGRSLPGGDLGEPSRWSSRPASWGLGPQLCSASATVFPPVGQSHLAFCLLSWSSDAVLFQIKIFKFSGEETVVHEQCWYSGYVVNVLCAVAEHMALPRRSRKVCERSG